MFEEAKMETYPIPMVPGPVSVPPEVLAALQVNYGSADLEPEFLDLYRRMAANLQKIMVTNSDVLIQTGEGMLALWGALKSCLKPGDRVLSIASGVFGFGIADMAHAIGASVKTVDIPYNQTISNWDEIEAAMLDHHPKMITAVHCETPSGTLNPLAELGRLKRQYKVPLLYVDAVASLGGAPVHVDEWGIDLCLGGSQKALAAPPDMSFLSVSPAAWEIINQVKYVGYDALLPFQTAVEKFYFPYTPNWHGVAALYAATDLLLKEGLEKSFQRHAQVADVVRKGLVEMGIKLYPAASAVPSPTVTAALVPEQIGWPELDKRFRAEGLAVGGSYGPLAGKVFRLGHMGPQADLKLAQQALAVIKKSIQ
jgi:aspartate aminotransferase-like enzyme